RVECERGLAGARQAREHDQPVSWQVEIDALQIVSACTTDADLLHQETFFRKTNECTPDDKSGNDDSLWQLPVGARSTRMPAFTLRTCLWRAESIKSSWSEISGPIPRPAPCHRGPRSPTCASLPAKAGATSRAASSRSAPS